MTLATMCAFTTDEEFNDLPFLGQTGENDPSARVELLVDYYPFVSLTGLDADLKEIGCSRLFFDLANSWQNGSIGAYDCSSDSCFRKRGK